MIRHSHSVEAPTQGNRRNKRAMLKKKLKLKKRYGFRKNEVAYDCDIGLTNYISQKESN